MALEHAPKTRRRPERAQLLRSLERISRGALEPRIHIGVLLAMSARGLVTFDSATQEWRITRYGRECLGLTPLERETRPEARSTYQSVEPFTVRRQA